MNSIAPVLMKLGLLAGVVTMTACTSIGYRCPLEGKGNAEHPTACAGMKDAMTGAKKGSGNRTSVLLDDKGRLIPPEARTGTPINPLVAKPKEPYTPSKGSPEFQQPEVFKVWSRAFVDNNGNLHGDHHAWFTTPGRWAYGTLQGNGEAAAVADSLMEPALPGKLPGKVVQTAPNKPTQKTTPSDAPKPLTAKERDEMALKSLSSAASSVAAVNATQRSIQGAAPGVTAPSISLMD